MLFRIKPPVFDTLLDLPVAFEIHSTLPLATLASHRRFCQPEHHFPQSSGCPGRVNTIEAPVPCLRITLNCCPLDPLVREVSRMLFRRCDNGMFIYSQFVEIGS